MKVVVPLVIPVNRRKFDRFEVHFGYNRNNGSPYLTYAQVLNASSKHVVTVGTSECQGANCFSRDTQRKKALANALKFIPRPQRVYFWEIYRNLTPTPRW
jgi:hypothetical protein